MHNQLLVKGSCKRDVRNKFLVLNLQFVDSNAVSSLEEVVDLFNAYKRTEA